MVTSLIIYPSYFDIHSSVMDEFEERLVEQTLTHYASQLLEICLYDESELETALQKAVTAMNTVQPPASNHFRKIFISRGAEVKTDWLVSDLGLRLIILNADVTNPIVARLQIEILSAISINGNHGNIHRHN
jgi:hypothetical protein